MPIGQFWLMNDCIERIRAEEDLRGFAVVNRAQGAEGGGKYLQDLRKSMGNFFVLDEEDVVDAERDEAGISELKML